MIDWPALLGWGFSPFPLRPHDKRPLGSWERYQHERATPEQIETWGRDSRLNAAIATGAVSGVIVLDTDSADAEADVVRRGVPATPTAKTAKGKHRYFAHPGGTVRNFAHKLPGLDLRGDGGYVVAAGSIHPTGVVYEWEQSPADVPFAPAPAWLLDLIRGGASVAVPPSAPASATGQSAYAERALDGELATLRRAAVGHRNDALNRAAFALGQLVGAGALDRGGVERHLVATAIAIGLSESESRATIRSGLDDGCATPRVIPERSASVGGGRQGRGPGRQTGDAAPVTNLAEERRRRERPAAEPAAPMLAPLDPICWQGLPVPERRWLAPGWIPDRVVTAFYGDGGKSLAAQQLLTACAAGKDWLGVPVTERKAMGFFCEDDADELHRRQANICRHYGVELGYLEYLRFFSRVGGNNVLMTFDNESIDKPTPLLTAIVTAAQEFGAQVLLIDTLADVFGGNENVRNQANQFIAALTKIAHLIDGAVILCAHPSLGGMSGGHGFAGSTAWNNSVRSRLYLTRPTTEDKQPVDPEERVLTRMKANYAAIGEEIRLRWREGVFIPQETGGMIGTINRGLAEKAFMDCLDSLDKQGRDVSDSQHAGNYAPRIMRTLPHGREFSVSELREAMERLFERREIQVVKTGRHNTRKVVRGSSGVSD
ncbi:MAG: bifunctional DNA primase/polymerase [Alphaproteobacteria bacterium]|nr:bifunctional DNA primase/polymerase [Alphaproteobacteria bacterium]